MLLLTVLSVLFNCPLVGSNVLITTLFLSVFLPLTVGGRILFLLWGGREGVYLQQTCQNAHEIKAKVLVEAVNWLIYQCSKSQCSW